jgi:hypothetical protein
MWPFVLLGLLHSLANTLGDAGLEAKRREREPWEKIQGGELTLRQPRFF